jgi:hypothetical protein
MRLIRSLSVALLVVLLTAAPVSVLYAQSDGGATPADDAASTVVISPNQQPADAVPVDYVAAFPAPRTQTTGCLSSGGLPDPAARQEH